MSINWSDLREVRDWRTVDDLIESNILSPADAAPLFVQVITPENADEVLQYIATQLPKRYGGSLREFVRCFDLSWDFASWEGARYTSYIVDGRLTPEFRTGMVYLKSRFAEEDSVTD